MLRVLKLYYQVTSSHLPAPQILRVLKLHYKVASARLHFARSTRAISAEGCAGTGQIALSPAFRAIDTHDLRRGWCGHRTNRTLACISRTRHARSPQRVARAWDKSHSRLHFAHSTRTISAEGCASSLQNERFVRDFLKNSHVKVCKTSVSYETSSKSQAETSIGAHTSRSPVKQFPDSSPSKQHPLTRQSQVTATFTSTTTHNLTNPCACHESFRVHTSNAHKVLRLPRNVTSVTPRNLTIPCACHENRASTPQILRLPRKVTISSHMSFKRICTTPHIWNDFHPFCAHAHPAKSPFQLRLVTKTELRCHTLKRKSQWHGHIQHPKNTTLQTLIPMELRSKLWISQNAAPVQRNASCFLRDMSWSCKSQCNSGAN